MKRDETIAKKTKYLAAFSLISLTTYPILMISYESGIPIVWYFYDVGYLCGLLGSNLIFYQRLYDSFDNTRYAYHKSIYAILIILFVLDVMCMIIYECFWNFTEEIVVVITNYSYVSFFVLYQLNGIMLSILFAISLWRLLVDADGNSDAKNMSIIANDKKLINGVTKLVILSCLSFSTSLIIIFFALYWIFNYPYIYDYIVLLDLCSCSISLSLQFKFYDKVWCRCLMNPIQNQTLKQLELTRSKSISTPTKHQTEH